MKEMCNFGQGGTGKTSLTASFAVIGGKDVVVADCDVDAADMHLLMQPNFGVSEDFYSGEVAFINQENCTQCGICLGSVVLMRFQYTTVNTLSIL